MDIENERIIIEKKLKKFIPSLEKIDQDYLLLSPALSKTKITKLLDELDTIPYTEQELDETTDILFNLVDEIAKNEVIKEMSDDAERKKVIREKNGIITGQDELLSIGDIKLGIERLFNYIDNNTNIVSSPADDDERKKLYTSFKKGFRYIAEILKDEYITGRRLDPIEIYGNLDIIANASNHCAMRWNDTLNQLVNNFKEIILKRKDIEVDKSNDPLVLNLKHIFFEAKIIEVDKMAENFIQEVYGNEIKKFGEGNVPHYVWIFKKEINTVYGLNLPIIDAKDSYIQHGGEEGSIVSNEVFKYIEDKDLSGLIFSRACQILSDKLKVDRKLCDAVIDWGGKYFDNNKFDLVIKGGKSEFLQEYIFTDVFSYQVSEFAMREIMLDKGFVQEDENESYKSQLYSKDQLSFRQIIKCLECMKRDGDKRIWEEILGKEEFFTKGVLELWYKFNQGENLFRIYIRDMPEHIFKDIYDNGYEFLRQGKNSAFSMEDVVYEIFRRGFLKYDDESVGLIIDELLFTEENENLEKILEVLCKNIDVNTKSTMGITPLMVASCHGINKLLVEILSKGVNINATEIGGFSALHYAAIKNQLESMEILIKHGIDVNAAENGGAIPLHWAVKNRNFKMVELLLSNGANPNFNCDLRGFSPLHMAILQNNIETVEILTQYGVNLNTKTKDGHAPLHLAVGAKFTDMIKFLIENKANINVRDSDGSTPLHWATSEECIKILLEGGANINVVDNIKGTVLHYLVEEGNVNLVELLLKNGADMEIKNKDGITPMDIALKNDNKEILELFQRVKEVKKNKRSGKDVLDIYNGKKSREF